jgi:hypothetical protein
MRDEIGHELRQVGVVDRADHLAARARVPPRVLAVVAIALLEDALNVVSSRSVAVLSMPIW